MLINLRETLFLIFFTNINDKDLKIQMKNIRYSTGVVVNRRV